MNSHSKIIQNTFGEDIRKDKYELGELVTIYRPLVNAYVHAIIIDINEREWVSSEQFKHTYTVALQNNDGSTATHIVKDIISIDLYLAETKQKLNEQHIEIAKRFKTFP